jgi:hypothetical protein
LTNQASGAPALPDLLGLDLLGEVERNLGALSGQLLADAGYFPQDNVAACV